MYPFSQSRETGCKACLYVSSVIVTISPWGQRARLVLIPRRYYVLAEIIGVYSGGCEYKIKWELGSIWKFKEV